MSLSLQIRAVPVLQPCKGRPGCVLITSMDGGFSTLMSTPHTTDSWTLLVQVDPENMAKHEIAPLLEIQLELIVPDIVWIPELSTGGPPGVRDMFSKWFKSFLEIATLIKRLDTGEGQWHMLLLLCFSLQTCSPHVH